MTYIWMNASIGIPTFGRKLAKKKMFFESQLEEWKTINKNKQFLIVIMS